MKYLYKQMLAFFLVILVTILTAGMIFVRFLVTNIYEEKEEQLFGYAEAVIDENMTLREVENGIDMISNQDVILAMYNSKDELIYPVGERNYSSGLGEEELLRLQKGERISLSERDRGFMNEDMSIVTVYLPLFKSITGEFSGFVAVASPISGIQKDITNVRQGIQWAILLSGAIAILFSIGFANYLSRRIIRMRRATKEITQGNFEIHLDDFGRDEFDSLSGDFNTMVDSLKASQIEIERQENLRRQFMMDVAHEMRTPLTTINGILEGWEHDMIPEHSRKRSIEIMHNESRRMIRMVNENLDYEKIRSEQVMLVKQQIPCLETLKAIKDQLSAKAATKGNTIHVSVSSATLTVYADYDRFIQIVVNLTNNAIQFTENGEISLTANAGYDCTIIKVSDTGMGMAKEEIPAIWERFYKADQSRKNNKYGESGIGLAIVKSLVDNHEGEITVESELGIGTVFTIKLPNKND
ncbi:ATP-binding protein [Jeotgalibaca sp. A122]|uniref:ATP-binding protein n=1 Tax=Jeotgalibaca sp. A122 TaxID=3457322 RepID=UPI003FD29454